MCRREVLPAAGLAANIIVWSDTQAWELAIEKSHCDDGMAIFGDKGSELDIGIADEVSRSHRFADH